MDNNYTHITFVIDRSGSMTTCWSDAINGLESFINEQKKGDDKCTFSLYSFDNAVDKNLDFANMKLISESVSDFDIWPRGSTALYDAIGTAIVETGKTLARMKEVERPGKVLFVIQTDGYENSSKEYSSTKVKEMITEQTEKYSWDFMFLGADINSVNDATTNLGIMKSNASVYNTINTLDSYQILNNKTMMYRSCVDVNDAKAAMAFTKDDKEILNKT